MTFENKIKELGIELPEAKAPVGSYVATKIVGKLLFISGQISISDNGDLIKGKIGKDLNTDEGYTYEFSVKQIIPGSTQLIKHANDKGYKVIVITNQSGIGRGY